MSIQQRASSEITEGAFYQRSSWRRRLRTYIISQGVRVICGSPDYVCATAAVDVPLLSAGARLALLKVLHRVGVESFLAKSGLGYDFLCHTGDLASFPFYHRKAYRSELMLCAAWLEKEHSPIVYDVGANGGFLATQLAQMLASRKPHIYAFEPAPTTFTKLVESVERLCLKDSVHPIAAAVTDESKPVSISYSDENSLISQLRPPDRLSRLGEKISTVNVITLDEFSSSHAVVPKLIKIDAEGSEVSVLRGARNILTGADRPAILFEYNPLTLAECGVSTGALIDLLRGYALFYVDDLRAQKILFGTPISNPEKIDWICNLFAVPLVEAATLHWESIYPRIVRSL